MPFQDLGMGGRVLFDIGELVNLCLGTVYNLAYQPLRSFISVSAYSSLQTVHRLQINH